MPGEAAVCPHCHRQQEHQDLRPLGGPSRQLPPPPPAPRPPAPSTEPLSPAPGQEAFGTLANIKAIARADPLFAVVLALSALGVVGNLLSGYYTGTIVSAATLWGLVTFRWWGYLLALATSGLYRLGFGAVTATALAEGHRGFDLIWGVVAVGISCFVVLVLLTRREHFD
jgi:hypothetical protein